MDFGPASVPLRTCSQVIFLFSWSDLRHARYHRILTLRALAWSRRGFSSKYMISDSTDKKVGALCRLAVCFGC